MSRRSLSGGDESGPSSKKAKRSCKWQSDWKRYHMSESKRGASYAHCDICQTDFSVASGGFNVYNYVFTQLLYCPAILKEILQNSIWCPAF